MTAGGLSTARGGVAAGREGSVVSVVADAAAAVRRACGAALAAVLRLAGVLTPLGRSILVAAPVGLVVGYRFGLLELVVAGFAGILLLVIAVAFLLGRGAHDIVLSVPHRRVVVGQPATGIVSAGNPLRRRLFGARLEIPVGRQLVEVDIPALGRGAESRREFAVPTARRGVLAIGPVRTVLADPIGLVRRELVQTTTTELFVHPATVVIPGSSAGLIRDLEGRPTRTITNSDVAFHALREYVAGDDRRYIHWKSTAKTGVNMVRQFEETRRSRMVVALGTGTADFAGPAEFELAVSCAGSLGLRAIRDGQDASVVVGRVRPESARRAAPGLRQLHSLSRARLLDDLAGIERSDRAGDLVTLAVAAADRITGVSVAYLVCGSPVTASSLRAAAAKFEQGIEVIAVVCDPDTIPGIRRVAGLSVLTIGSLGDLQRSLARAAAV